MKTKYIVTVATKYIVTVTTKYIVTVANMTLTALGTGGIGIFFF